MARLLGRFVHESPEWREARRWRVGGSEIGVVCGFSPHQTADRLLVDKLSGAFTEATDAQLRGQCLEPGIEAWTAAKYGLAIDHDLDGTYVSDARNWQLYNPDGITPDGWLLEFKTTNDRSEVAGWGRAGTDQVPLHHAAQVQWGLGVLGLDRAALVVLYGAHNGRVGLGFAKYTIRFDPAVFAALTDTGLRFIDRLNEAKGLDQ